MPTCKLCLSEATLRNSHIHPEFLYRDLYNDQHQLMGINGEGHRGYAVLQKGLRDSLLGDCCESFLNREYENPFLRDWIDAGVPETFRDEGVVYSVKVPDYARFKLFHLSILLRASWSGLGTYADVSLGPKHEERIRRMLLGGDPGKAWLYPIFGYGVADLRGKEPWPILSRPMVTELGGLRTYASIYAGVAWNIGVASHLSREFSTLGLQPDGTLHVIATDFRDTVEAKLAADNLRAAEAGRPVAAELHGRASRMEYRGVNGIRGIVRGHR